MATSRTLYDVLGVRPDASADELRRAYRERARELHPDRHVDAGPAEQAVAARRMQEVTDAWRVLGHAGRRRTYDRELAGPTTYRYATRDDGERFATRTDGTMPEDIEPMDGTARLIRSLPWIALAAVLVVIFIFSAYAITGGPKDGGGTGNGSRIGECVTIGSDGTITPASCDSPGAREIVMLVGPSNSCPTGTDRRQPPSGSAVYCLRNA